MDRLDLQLLKEQLDYHNYLLKKSILGSLYRKYILHPYIDNFVKGLFCDVGCGVGDYLIASRHHGIGIDINPYNVEYVKTLGHSAVLIDTDGRFPLSTNSVDSVVIDNVIEHLYNPDSVLQESVRILKPGGIIVILVPCLKGYSRDKTHVQYYDRSAIKSILIRYGFRIVVSRYIPLPLEWAGRVLGVQSLLVQAMI